MDKKSRDHDHTVSNARRLVAGLFIGGLVGALVLTACSGATDAQTTTPIAVSVPVGALVADNKPAADIVMAVNPTCVSGSSFGITEGHNYVEFRPNFCAQNWDSKVHGPYLEAELKLWNLPDPAHDYVARAGLPMPGDLQIPIFNGGRLFGKWLPSEFSICTK